MKYLKTLLLNFVSALIVYPAFAQGPLSCCDVPGWMYVRDIELNNTGNPARNNYQVLLVINTQTPISQGKMRANGGDIRFTTTKCGQFLDYWIEGGINTTATEIWVVVPTIPANGTEIIYMYYGNAGATAVSNFNAVFTNVLTINGAQTLNGNQTAEWIDIRPGANITLTTSVSFNARKIIFDGNINGDFRGYAPGSGPGAGGNGNGSVGGGGGGYGGQGGNGGGGQGFGGPAYGTTNGTDIDRGSGGGGSDCNASAAGGGAVSLTAASIEMNGTISVRGQNAQSCCCNDVSEAAGGGAGGGILLLADYLEGNGALTASGGRGGDSDDKEGGGGGGGGRIKFLHVSGNSFSGTTNVTPGQPGNGNQCCPQPGQAGTMADVNLPDYITVRPEKPIRVFPVADFSSNNVCAGASATFTDLTTIASGAVATWQWDFGDALASSQQNPTHNYAAEGTYSVTLTVSSDSTCTHATTQQVTVYSAPAAAFNFTNVCFGAPVNFIDQSSVTLPYTIASWSWDFGNAQTATQQNTSNTYPAAGTYDVTLIVTTDVNCQNSVTQTVEVFPSLSLGLSPTDVLCAGASTGAIDLSVTGGAPAFIFDWDNNSTAQNLSVIPAGTYTVIVTDANNCSATGSATVQEPVDGISVNETVTDVACFGGNNGSVNLLVSGGTLPYFFNWSNNASSASINQLHTDDYAVTVTDDNGCILTATYTVSEPPQLLLEVTPADTTLNFGVPLQFSSALTPADLNATYSWLPNTDLSCADCENPQMTGVGTRTYFITIQNSDGCFAYDTATVTVLLDKILFIPNAFTPNQDGVNDVFQVYTYGDKRFKMSIYDRWGGEVFIADDRMQGWDGTAGGKEINQGVYVYEVYIEYLDRTVQRMQGSVTVIK